MTNSLGLFSAMLDHGIEPLKASAFGRPKEIALLLTVGLIARAGAVISVVCPECSGTHEVEMNDGQTGWMCDAVGWVDAAADEVEAVCVKPEKFVELLRDQADVPRHWAKPRKAPLLWSIGSYLFQDCRVGVYFMLGAVDLEQFSEAREFLKQEPRSDGVAVLTNDRRDLSQLALPCNGRIIPITDCIELGTDGRIALDRRWIAERVLPEHLLRPAQPGRPNRAERMAAELIRELDCDGALGDLSTNKRHRVLLDAAKARNGEETTLSKLPCDKAWAAYLAENSGI
jgi:hypothetical protein